MNNIDTSFRQNIQEQAIANKNLATHFHNNWNNVSENNNYISK